jgi:hypothetical protein
MTAKKTTAPTGQSPASTVGAIDWRRVFELIALLLSLLPKEEQPKFATAPSSDPDANIKSCSHEEACYAALQASMAAVQAAAVCYAQCREGHDHDDDTVTSG